MSPLGELNVLSHRPLKSAAKAKAALATIKIPAITARRIMIVSLCPVLPPAPGDYTRPDCFAEADGQLFSFKPFPPPPRLAGPEAAGIDFGCHARDGP